MKQKIVIPKKVYFVAVMLIALVPRLFFVMRAMPVKVLKDEVITLNGAALLAGFDWSEVISNGSYYGFGFYALCAPLFHILHDPISIYRGILIIATVAQAAGAGICFYICDKYMDLNKNYLLISFISIISNYAVVTRTTIAYNEHPLILISWLVALLVCKYIYEKKTIYFGLLFLLIGYALTIHTRVAVLLIGVDLVLFSYEFMKRRYKRIGIGILLSGIVYMSADWLCNQYRLLIWGSEKNITNSEYVVKLSDVQLSPTLFKAWGTIVLGQIHSANFFLAGFAVIFVITFFFFCFREKEKSSCKELIITFFMIFFLSIGGTILAQSLSWLSGVYQGMQDGIANAYSYKAVSYVRYYGPYIGPLVMCGLIVCIKQQVWLKKNLLFGIFTNVLLLKVWLRWILPYTTGKELYMPFGWMRGYADISVQKTQYAILVVVILGILMVGAIYCKKPMVSFLIAACMLLYQYCFMAEYADIREQRAQADKLILQTYEHMKDYEDLDEIYVHNGLTLTGQKSYYLYQFFFYDSKVHSGIPSEGYQGVLFSDQNVDEMLGAFEWEKEELTDRQYIYYLN